MTHTAHERSPLSDEGDAGGMDPVQAASEQSFPASDPPSTWSGEDPPSSAP